MGPVLGLRLLVDDGGLPPSSEFARTIRLDASKRDADDAIPFCELLVANVMTGVFDSSRQHLRVLCGASAKFSDQPESVNAVVCSTAVASSSEPGFTILLAPKHGVSFLLPREGATSASQVRVRPSEKPSSTSNVVVLARGTDPYATLLDAVRLLPEATGISDSAAHAYVLPLVDGVNRLKYDTALATAKSAVGNVGSSVAPAYEQQLHESILVQAGPGCPAKPLLQAPGLRLCQGVSTPLGLRYSGMSVVYGTATGHVLAVMDTPAALKMAPPSGMRTSNSGTLTSSRSAGHLLGAETPSTLSTSVSDTTSATPSPPMSRSNSLGGDNPTLDIRGSLVSVPSAPPLGKVLSGRSITTAPVIQVLAATSTPATAESSGRPPRASTPTGAPAQVLASFALLGLKSSNSRDSTVRCCRIMPGSTLQVALENLEEGALKPGSPGLGLVVQADVVSTRACTLLLFVEGPEEEGLALTGGEEARPVQSVLVDGQPARWRYDATGDVLSVELPAAPKATAPRSVQVFL